MNRGYFGVALHRPQKAVNIGGVMRACGCFNANFAVIEGKFRRQCSDTKNWDRHMPVFETEDLFKSIPYGCIPVAVDLLDGVKNLVTFEHPERAIYIFGSEGETLPSRVTDRCPIKLVIPSNGCLNLAASVNVILYDRIAKQITNGNCPNI